MLTPTVLTRFFCWQDYFIQHIHIHLYNNSCSLCCVSANRRWGVVIFKIQRQVYNKKLWRRIIVQSNTGALHLNSKQSWTATHNSLSFFFLNENNLIAQVSYYSTLVCAENLPKAVWQYQGGTIFKPSEFNILLPISLVSCRVFVVDHILYCISVFHWNNKHACITILTLLSWLLFCALISLQHLIKYSFYDPVSDSGFSQCFHHIFYLYPWRKNFIQLSFL